MVLQSSGTISLSQIGGEFSKLNPLTLSQFYNADLGVPKRTDPVNPGRLAPEISFSDFYGTRSVFTYSWNPSGTTITYAGASRTAVAVDNFNMLQSAVSAGWNGYSSLIWEIDDSIMAYATSRARPAMQMDYINNSPAGYGPRWPREITIDNRGWIMGRGGNGSNGNGQGQSGGGALYIRGTTGSIEDNEDNSGNAGGTGLVIIQNTKAILGGGGGGNGGSTGVAGGGGGGAGGGRGGNKGGAGGAGGGPFSSGGNGTPVAAGGYQGLGGQAGGGGGGWDSRGKSADAYGGGGGGGRVPGKDASGGSGQGGGGSGGAYDVTGGNGGDSGGGGGYGKQGGTSSSQGTRSAGGYAISVAAGATQYVPVGVAFQLEGSNNA